jgi:sarcosine oxidase subunit gamma
MSAYRVTQRAALADRKPVVRTGVSLEALAEGTVLHLLARPNTALPEIIGDAALSGLSLRSVSVGQWFAVGPVALRYEDLDAIEQKLKPVADVVDQSHGRVGIRVRGLQATHVLAKGTAVDLSDATFPVGRSTTALIGHIAAHITRTEEDAFELLVLRGFAESLWDDLVRMSLEFS